jgi:gliding motility-associated-like protein
LTVDFKDTVQVAKSYEWYFGDGTPMVTGTSPNISHTYNSTGTFKVMMVAIDPDLCVPRDTTYTHIRVSDIKAALDFTPIKLNPCDSFKYRFDNISTASGGHAFGAQSFIWDFGDNSPRIITGMNSVTRAYAGPGTYNVKLILKDTAFCNNNDSIVKQVRVSAFVKAGFDTPADGCAPYDAAFSNTSQGGAQFYWTFGDGGSSTQSSPTHNYASPGTFTVKLVVVDSATCNVSDSMSEVITIHPKPLADFNPTPQPPSVNTPISFENLSSADAVRFLWDFGDGDTLATTSRAIVKHEYNQTKTYNACLTAWNEAGCADKICKDVSNVVESAVDVPNAFTPQSGDINSKVFVRGFGIAKMKFTIWSRWGEKVFETDSKSVGWDGRYKGKILPMDVYAYTLDVEFGDGTSVRRKGDITLIR